MSWPLAAGKLVKTHSDLRVLPDQISLGPVCCLRCLPFEPRAIGVVSQAVTRVCIAGRGVTGSYLVYYSVGMTYGVRMSSRLVRLGTWAHSVSPDSGLSNINIGIHPLLLYLGFVLHH